VDIEPKIRLLLSSDDIGLNKLTKPTERPHQGKGNVILSPSGQAKSPEGAIECRERLGGLLKYYHRQAA